MKEINFDGLVGPTFNFGGIAQGNLASQKHGGLVSHPRQAALQGLQKMRALTQLGIPQGIFPPHHRPHLPLARRMGFSGSDANLLKQLLAEAPAVLAACYSSSAMWTANAATVCPSADATDRKVHFTPANLQNQLHRSIEPGFTHRCLTAIFDDSETFVVHAPLPSSAGVGDEGAANHTRFATRYAEPGVQFFVYGESTRDSSLRPSRFPARQTLEASEAVARMHTLEPKRVVFAQQNPEAIDRGVFHNDVISVGNLDVFFFHEDAFVDTQAVIHTLQSRFSTVTGHPLRLIQVSRAELDIPTCVSTYLFNSQLVYTSDHQHVLIAPRECSDHPQTQAFIDRCLNEKETPLDAVHYQEVNQSMSGGGGPACLRLRVALTDHEITKVAPGALLDEQLYDKLTCWINKHYRETLELNELADPQLIREAQSALDELTQLMGLESLYDFQLEDTSPRNIL